jgi:hypothetical protein
VAFISAFRPLRNPLATFAIGALFIAMGVFGPSWYKKETELRCDPGWKLMAIYPDMAACSAAMPQARQCGCSTLPNEWAPLFSNYFVPIVLGIVAWLLLSGRQLTRVAWLNAGFWGSIFVMGIYYAFTNAEGVEGLVLSFSHFIYVALAASGVLLLCHLLARGITSLLQTRAHS